MSLKKRKEISEIDLT
ncbi:unnamed protein product, partial [Allacma fusca]